MTKDQDMKGIPGSISYAPKGSMWVATLKVGEGDEVTDLEIGSIVLLAVLENDSLREEFEALTRKTVNHIVVHNSPETKIVFKEAETES